MANELGSLLFRLVLLAFDEESMLSIEKFVDFEPFLFESLTAVPIGLFGLEKAPLL
jgi:hypothetical protein